MDKHHLLAEFIRNNPDKVSSVVDFNPATDKLLKFDFTASNTELSADDLVDTAKFSTWVNQKLEQCSCRYGIGGYMEHRTIYTRSTLFDSENEPRRLHLGIDIWAPAGTPVYAAFDGKIHSFQDNAHFGDYGPTIILEHNLDGLAVFSLYGHLNRKSLIGLTVGQAVKAGQQIAEFGDIEENGNWPPHLHFQLMFDMQDWKGDYPGVGQYSQETAYRENIPDPDMILQFSAATII